MGAAGRVSLVFAGLTAGWAFSTWANSHEEFSPLDSLGFALHGGLVLAVQWLTFSGLSYIAEKKQMPRFVPLALLAAFCVFNLHTLVLIHYDSIAALTCDWMALMLFALFAAFFLLFKILADSPAIAAAVYAFLALFILQAAGTFLWSGYAEHRLIATAGQIPAHFTFPEFQRRPNVYLIGFDAMTPAVMTKGLMGIEEPQYIATMREEGFRILKNVFAEKVPTKPSFNSVVAMDMDLFNGVKVPQRFYFMTGRIQGPLYKLFRENGYKIQVVYQSSYFGPREKADLDYYGIALQSGVCSHVDADYALMGYCLEALENLRGRFFGAAVHDYPQFLFDRIRETTKSPDRWLTISHIFRPSHTPRSYDPRKPADVKEYHDQFVRKLDPKAAIYMRELVKTIRENDPEAVLIVFGDHGLFVTRGLSQTKDEKDSPFTPRQAFLDRRAIAMGVWPKDFCPEGFEEPYVNIRLGRSLAKCLSGGKDMLPEGFQPVDRYNEYIYE